MYVSVHWGILKRNYYQKYFIEDIKRVFTDKSDHHRIHFVMKNNATYIISIMMKETYTENDIIICFAVVTNICARNVCEGMILD